MQININVCKKVAVSYAVTTGSLTVDFESSSENALAALLSGGNFRARFFVRRMFVAQQPNELRATAEQRGAKVAAEYQQQLEAAIKQDGLKIAHGIFTVLELSNGAMNAVSVPRQNGTRVVMTSLTRDSIVNQDVVDENLQATLLNEASSILQQGLANGRYQPATAQYQPVTIGAAPQQAAAQPPVNPLQGLQAAAPEQQPAQQAAATQSQQPMQQAPAF